jgi:hypothetical protein
VLYLGTRLKPQNAARIQRLSLSQGRHKWKQAHIFDLQHIIQRINARRSPKTCFRCDGVDLVVETCRDAPRTRPHAKFEGGQIYVRGKSKEAVEG